MKQKTRNRLFKSILLTLTLSMGSSAALQAGPKGKIQVRPLGGSSITIDGDISDWPLAKFGAVAQQPVFPEGQNSTNTSAQGDHIVFDRARVGRFNGTTEEAFQAGPSDFGSTIYFAHDSGFLYLLGVFIDDRLRDDRDTGMCSDGMSSSGATGFFNDGFEFFIDAKGDSKDCIADTAFPTIDPEAPNIDDFQVTVSLNSGFKPANAEADILGAVQTIERAGNIEFVGAEKGCNGTFRDVLKVFNNLKARDIAAKSYANLRTAGARNPEILANPGTTYTGYAIEMRIPFGRFDGFSSDHSMGFELFWRDVDGITDDAEGKDVGAGGGDISWASWGQSTEVACTNPKASLFHAANWGELVFSKDNPLTPPHTAGGPKGKITPIKVSTPITVDGSLADWPLASFTKVARQPVFPEGQNAAATTADGDHIVFEKDRVGLFNGTSTEAFQANPSDFGSSIYFAYDAKFLYLMEVRIDDVYRDGRDTSTHGSAGFFNDGFEFFIDALGDSTDCASDLNFPNFDAGTPNHDDFQLTVALNSMFKPAGAAADVFGTRQTIERAGDPYLVGVAAPAEKGGPGGIFRDALIAANAADGGRDIFTKSYTDLRAAGALNPEILANPGTKYTGYILEMRIPFGKFNGFTPDHTMGFELFWRDVDKISDDPEGKDVGAGGGDISWATWAQSTDVPCTDPKLALFHTRNWGSLVFPSAPTQVTGLLGYWPMNQTEGTAVRDWSGKGNSGKIINNAANSWVNDAERGAVYQATGTNVIDFGVIVPAMTLSNNFTWSLWLKSFETGTATTPNNNIVFGNRYGPAGSDFSPREFIKFTPSKFEWHANAAGQDVDYADYTTNKWTHHMLVKSANKLTYYRDGVETTNRTITATPKNPQPLYLGGQGTQERWKGLADDVAVFDRDLSAAEAQQVFALGKAGQTLLPPPLLLTSGGVVGANLTLNWTGGQAPFRVQRRESVASGSWTDVATTNERTATVPVNGSTGFFRIIAN